MTREDLDHYDPKNASLYSNFYNELDNRQVFERTCFYISRKKPQVSTTFRILGAFRLYGLYEMLLDSVTGRSAARGHLNLSINRGEMRIYSTWTDYQVISDLHVCLAFGYQA